MKRLLKSALVLGILLFGLLAIDGPNAGAKDNEIRLGQAQWTSNLEVARLRSQSSGKPVLLFDMIGRLDEKWC